MHNILLIAKREYLEQIHGRAFKFSTVLLPLLIGVMLGISFFTGRNAVTGGHVVIATQSAPLADEIRRSLLDDKEAKFTVDVIAPATRQDRDAMLRLVHNKTIDGILWIDTTSSGAPSAVYTSHSSTDVAVMTRMREALNSSLIQQRLLADGLKQSEADSLLKEVPIESLQLNKEGKVVKNDRMKVYFKTFALSFLIAMPILLYGLDLARSIIEEKSSRIFEVLLAVAKPDDLLTGKLFGVGAIGLTQMAIWMVGGALFTGPVLASTMLGGHSALHFSWAEGVFFPVYFVLGFFLCSAVFSGLAATCDTAQELQMYMPLAAFPVWLSFGSLPFLLNDPDSVWAIALSFFPPTAPFVMVARMELEMPPVWQFAVSIGLLMLSIWAALWFSSRLYRVGILMYGKRATLPEIMRWLRYS